MNKVIFYVHKGNPDYLKESIKFSKARNKKINLILLGDESNRDLCERWENLKNLESTMLNEFKERYVHMSTNIESYEFFCFARWFYILEYMKQNKIDQAGYIDSDVLLCDIPDYIWKEDYCYTANSGHTSFFKYDAIEKLCNFFLESYSNSSCLEELKEHFKLIEKTSGIGGICDMTLISKFALLNNYRDLFVINNLEIFDHNIGCSDNYQYNNGMKVLFYKDNNYYYRIGMSSLLIKCNSMHFQGDAKTMMKYIYRDSNDKELMYFNNKNNLWEKYDLNNYKILHKKKPLYQLYFKIWKKIDTISSLKK